MFEAAWIDGMVVKTVLSCSDNAQNVSPFAGAPAGGCPL